MPFKNTIFVVADHGLAIIYFLQSQVISSLIQNGSRVVLLTQDALVEQVRDRFGQQGLIVEGLRYDRCDEYARTYKSRTQWWLQFLRRVGTSNRINTEAMDSYIRQVDFEAKGRQKLIMPFAKMAVKQLRKSSQARKKIVQYQMKFTPFIYRDLFEKYQPSLVVSSTYGWRNDRYILREAHTYGIMSGAVIVGWDNPSSYGIPSAPMDFVNCWSDIQKQELIDGSDWSPDKVNVGGIPSYDNYFNKSWLISREKYFKKHNLDPQRKLIAYASSFVTFSPNYRNIKTLANLVSNDELDHKAQLLVRLHPNHFLDKTLFVGERKQIFELADRLPNVHVVEPVALAGNLGNYSGEDMDEKTSMMAHADVFTTVYSTMCVECAIHNRPIISVVLDEPGGWNDPNKFSLALSEIDKWPTHTRFLASGAGKVATDSESLRRHLNTYLNNDKIDSLERMRFVKDEITFTDGNAGIRTGDYLFSLAQGGKL
ncbi:MAG: hypothetical protein PHT43_05235 [Anaerolineaceae bacterium]|nr:hypothetical protein [Anaerolineaceae bacterium]